MYQIDNSTAAAALPASTASGTAGYFTDGNPATGTVATIMPAEFMNMLMMENINILAAAGIAPDKKQHNQLAQAISKISSSGSSWNKINGKPTTRDGYGLTDVPSKTEVDTALIKKADKATTLAGYGITDGMTAAQVNVAIAGKANKSTTLAGYGVNFADQSEAEGGTDPHKPMNALGVFQAITKYLTQATETACGLMKVATAEEVNAGRDDTMAITPKKLRLGIQLQLSKAGYVIFPTWLGGIIIQWDGGLTMEGGTTNTTYFPIPFPDAAFAVVVGGFNNAAQLGAYSVYLSDGASGAGGALEKFAFKTRNTGLTGAAGLSYIAIGK